MKETDAMTLMIRVRRGTLFSLSNVPEYFIEFNIRLRTKLEHKPCRSKRARPGEKNFLFPKMNVRCGQTNKNSTI